MRKILIMILSLALALSLALCVSANEAEKATDISENTDISGKGYKTYQFLKDKRLNYYKSSGNTTLVLTNEEGMASLYLMFDYEYGQYTIKDTNNGRSITAGTYMTLSIWKQPSAIFPPLSPWNFPMAQFNWVRSTFSPPVKLPILFRNGNPRWMAKPIFL